MRPQNAWTIFNEQLDIHLVVWNPALHTASIRCSVAHEIGHIILNHQRSWPTDVHLKKRQKEKEANVFANCLLAPFCAIQTFFGCQMPSQRLIANRFDIPPGAARRVQQDYAHWLDSQREQ